MKKPLIAILAAMAALGTTALKAQAPATPPATRTIWDGVFTTTQASAGKALFDDKCSTCHGPELMGAEMAPPLAGAVFLANWNGLAVADLATRIHTTMPANDPGSLNDQQVTEAIAYILSYNQFPAGSTPLPTDQAGQAQITIAAQKPAGK
jgi:mono/diheme cytochrome c family protein